MKYIAAHQSSKLNLTENIDLKPIMVALLGVIYGKWYAYITYDLTKGDN